MGEIDSARNNKVWSTQMQTTQTSLIARDDTFLGVCQALGDDLGFNPLWLRLAGGCHLLRDAPALLEAAGFHIAELDTHYLHGTPRLLGYHSLGVAHP